MVWVAERQGELPAQVIRAVLNRIELTEEQKALAAVAVREELWRSTHSASERGLSMPARIPLATLVPAGGSQRGLDRHSDTSCRCNWCPCLELA
jgi:hypothetical protein